MIIIYNGQLTLSEGVVMKKVFYVFWCLMIATTVSAFARDGRGMGGSQGGMQKIVIKLYGEQFKGQNTIFLKKEIKQLHPNMQLKKKQLMDVIIVAKSKHGRGKASLNVGGSMGPAEILDGDSWSFHDEERYTYSRVSLEKPSFSSQGKWQIKLRGNIKIKKIIVKVKKKMFARKKLVLDYDGEQFRGQNTLFLKKKIKQMYPMMKLNNKKIASVVLVAKSKQGRGQASLKVGQSVSDSETVYGEPMDFFDNSSYTFDQVFLENPSYYNTQGVWQIKLKGNIKVQKVIVKFE
jgi:hypothetical protein